MLVFNTCIPISTACTITDLIKVGVDWRVNSPHSTISDKLRSINFDIDRHEIENENEEFQIDRCKYKEVEAGGVRHVVNEDKVRWATEVVGSKTENDFYVSVSIHQDSEYPIIDLPEPKKPYVIKMISRNMDLGCDGSIPVESTPKFLSEDEIHIAKSIILGKHGCSLPLIYISSNYENKHLINYKTLSKILSCMAHVYVEPSRHFSRRLMTEVDSINAYNGAVGIYWPNSNRRWIFLPRDIKRRDIYKKIVNIVAESLLSQRTKGYCSWSKIQELKSKSILREISRDDSEEVKRYIEAFDSEIQSKNKDIESLRQEIDRLNAKLYTFEFNAVQEGNPQVSLCGEEEELYADEKKSLLLSLLKNISGLEVGSRKKDIVMDIVRSNDGESLRDSMLSEIKSLFNDYRKMTPKIRKGLERLGFVISEDGKHYKMRFQNDDRYVVVIPKTSSDVKAGRNMASDIARKML